MSSLTPKNLSNILWLYSLNNLNLHMIDFMQDKASDDIGPAVYSRQLTLGC